MFLFSGLVWSRSVLTTDLQSLPDADCVNKPTKKPLWKKGTCGLLLSELEEKICRYLYRYSLRSALPGKEVNGCCWCALLFWSAFLFDPVMRNTLHMCFVRVCIARREDSPFLYSASSPGKATIVVTIQITTYKPLFSVNRNGLKWKRSLSLNVLNWIRSASPYSVLAINVFWEVPCRFRSGFKSSGSLYEILVCKAIYKIRAPAGRRQELLMKSASPEP